MIVHAHKSLTHTLCFEEIEPVENRNVCVHTFMQLLFAGATKNLCQPCAPKALKIFNIGNRLAVKMHQEAQGHSH